MLATPCSGVVSRCARLLEYDLPDPLVTFMHGFSGFVWRLAALLAVLAQAQLRHALADCLRLKPPCGTGASIQHHRLRNVELNWSRPH